MAKGDFADRREHNLITEVETETTQPPAKMAAARSWKRPGSDSSLEDSALLTPGSLPVKLT